MTNIFIIFQNVSKYFQIRVLKVCMKPVSRYNRLIHRHISVRKISSFPSYCRSHSLRNPTSCSFKCRMDWINQRIKWSLLQKEENHTLDMTKRIKQNMIASLNSLHIKNKKSNRYLIIMLTLTLEIIAWSP